MSRSKVALTATALLLSLSAIAQDFTFKRDSVLLNGSTTAAADATSTYVFKATTPKKTGADIPAGNTITYSFPVGTLVQGTDPNNGNAAVNVTATFKHQNGGSNDPVSLTFGTDANTGGPTITFTVPVNDDVAVNKTFTTTFTGIVNPTTGGSKVASITANNSSTGGRDLGSVGYTIIAAAANKLAFTSQPTAPVYSGRPMNIITVQVQDTFGNPVTTSTASIAMAIGTNPGNTGTLSGTTTVAASSGVATFSNLTMTGVNTGYRLAASSGTLSSATSDLFDVIVPTANQLVFSQQPTNALAGAAISPAVTVTVKDSFGTTVTTGSFTINLVTFQGAPISGNTTQTTTAGVATFSNISIALAGTYNLRATEQTNVASAINSNAFTISPNTTTTPVLKFYKQPIDTIAGNAASAGTNDNDSPILSAHQPDVPIAVSIEDGFGNIRTDLGTNKTITLGIFSGPGTDAANLFGTITSKAGVAVGNFQQSGVAFFDNLDINLSGIYQLKATDTSDGYTQGVSNSFEIIADDPASLTVTGLSAPSTVGVPTSMTVQLRDEFNNGAVGTVSFSSTDNGTNPARLPASPYTFVKADNGSVTFLNGVMFKHVGAGSQSVTASNTVGVTTITGSQTVQVNKGTPVFSNLLHPTIAFGANTATLSGKVSLSTIYGVLIPTGSVKITLNSVQQTVSVLGDGSFSSDFDTHLLAVGSYTITYAYLGDADFNSISDTNNSLTVGKADQTIINFNDMTKTYGDADFSPGATADPSGLTVSYSSGNTNVATITGGGLIHIVGAGTANITASQAGNANYNPAANVVKQLSVAKANQTITFGALPAKTYGDADFAPGATSDSGLTVVYTSDDASVATITGGGLIHIVGAGNTTIRANQPGNTNYNAAAEKTQALNVAKATTSFSNLSHPTIKVADTATTPLGGTVNFNGPIPSGEHVTITVTGRPPQDAPINSADGTFTVNYNTLPLSIGNYTIVYQYAGDGNFNGISDNTNDLIVSQGDPSTTIIQDFPNPSQSGTSVIFTATVSPQTQGGITPTGYVVFDDGGVVLGPGNGHITLDGSGSASLTVQISGVGAHTITASYSGDLNYLGSTDSRTQNVVSGTSSIAITNVNPVAATTYGDSVSFTATITTATNLPLTDTVTFKDGNTVLGTIALDATPANTATFTTTALSAVAHTNITATYNGNVGLGYPQSISAAASHTVNARPITVTAQNKLKTYGNADPAFTYTNGTLYNGDTFSGSLSRDPGENIGDYDITQGTLALSTNYAITYVKGNLHIGTRAVTITADLQSKTYGDNDPALTYQITSGSLAFSDTFSGNLSRDPGENIGQYNITQGNVALNGNYVLSYVGDKLTIGTRAVTIVGENKSKVYGDADPAFTYHITSGSLKSGDSFSGGLDRNSGENVGSYDITQGSLTLGSNYALTYTPGAKLDIVARPIEVTADGKDKVYGDPDPDLTFSISSGSLAFSDAFTGALSRDPGEDVGDYAILQNSLALNSNYTLSYVGDFLSISQRGVTVTADAQTKVYGDADPALTYQITLGNLVNGDSFTGALTRDSGEDVGNYGIRQGTLALSSNYILGYVRDDLVITARPITVTADAKSKIYGDADPALTYQVTGTLVGSDAFSGGLTRAAGETVAGGPYAIQQGSLALSNNYSLNYVGANFTITKRTLTLTAVAQTKNYDGNATSSGTPTISGLQGSDTVTGLVQAFNNKNVGTNKTMSVTAYTVNDGNSGGNYTVNTVTNGNGEIDAVTLTLTAVAETKNYDGNATSSGTPTVSGLKGTDTVTGLVQAFNNKNVGTNKTMSVTAYTVNDGNSGGNYTVSTVTNGSGEIDAVALTITAVAQTKNYDGNATSSGTPTVSGLKGTDTVTGLVQAFDNKNVGTNKTMSVTAYTVNDGNSGGNYTVGTVTNGSGVIDAVTLTITAVVETKNYDGNATSSGTPTVSGLKGTDTVTGLVQVFNNKNVSTNKTMTVTAYTVNDGNSGGNYTVSTVTNGSGEIDAVALTITAVAETKTYDGNATSSGTPTVSGLKGTDTVTGLVQVFNNKNVGTNKTMSVTAYTVNDGNSGGNYTVGTVTNGNGEIDARAITVTAKTDSKIFDGTTTSTVFPTVTSGSIIAGDTGNFSQTFDTANVGTNKTLTATGSVTDGNSGSNYSISFATVSTGAITKAATSTAIASSSNPSNAGANVTITATVTGPGGTPTGTVTFTVDGVAQTTAVTLTNGTAALTTSSLAFGDHAISAAYNGAANYSGSTSSTLTQKIIDTTPPVSSGPPTTDVSTGTVGDPVTFTWVVTDNTQITYVWDFGDGTVVTTTGTSVTHTFTVPSTFPIKVTATDEGGQSISSSSSLVVSAAATPSNDICEGLNPIAMSVKQVAAKLKFPSTLNKDTLALKTVINLPDGFSPAGKTVQWQIGDVVGSTSLDVKGNSPKSATIRATLRFKKPAKGGAFTARPGTLMVSMKFQSLSKLVLTGIPDLNVTTTGTKGQTASTDICVVLKDIQAYHADAASGLYKAKKDKAGAFSAKFK